MGGSIAITLREKDGTEYRMMRWTNIIPYFVCHPAMINGDKAHIEEFLDQWKKMKQDSFSKKYEFPMTKVYEPYDNACLHPDSYGLVVIDFVNHIILSMQGYCGINVKHVSCILLNKNFYYDEDEIKVIKQLCNDGRAELEVFDVKSSTKSLTKIISYEHLLQLLNEQQIERGASFATSKLIVDMKPFAVEKFEETKKGSKALRKRVLELGFKLSRAEINAWNEWDKEAY